jgi:hypothetical protein
VNATLPEVGTIEHLDFTPEIPCEHSQHHLGIFGHEGPAHYLVRVDPPCGCAPPADYFYICKGGYHDPSPVRCWECLKEYPAPQVWHIIAKVGS